MSVSLRQPVPPTGTARAALSPNKWPFAVLMIRSAAESIGTLRLDQTEQTNFKVRLCNSTFPRRLSCREPEGQHRISITLFARLERSMIPRPTHTRARRYLVPRVLDTGDLLDAARRSR